jgi:hypothetical protein
MESGSSLVPDFVKQSDPSDCTIDSQDLIGQTAWNSMKGVTHPCKLALNYQEAACIQKI